MKLSRKVLKDLVVSWTLLIFAVWFGGNRRGKNRKTRATDVSL